MTMMTINTHPWRATVLICENIQLQNEKRKMLMEHETSKLKELDESYAKEFKDWKADLKPRKQVKLVSSDNLAPLKNLVDAPNLNFGL